MSENDKYHQLKRLSFQNLGRYMTKTELKEYIRNAVENNDWIVFSSHIHSIDESMVADENAYNIANVVELLEYANSLCQMKHTIDIWNNRKILWELR